MGSPILRARRDRDTGSAVSSSTPYVYLITRNTAGAVLDPRLEPHGWIPNEARWEHRVRPVRHEQRQCISLFEFDNVASTTSRNGTIRLLRSVATVDLIWWGRPIEWRAEAVLTRLARTGQPASRASTTRDPTARALTSRHPASRTWRHGLPVAIRTGRPQERIHMRNQDGISTAARAQLAIGKPQSDSATTRPATRRLRSGIVVGMAVAITVFMSDRRTLVTLPLAPFTIRVRRGPSRCISPC